MVFYCERGKIRVLPRSQYFLFFPLVAQAFSVPIERGKI